MNADAEGIVSTIVGELEAAWNAADGAAFARPRRHCSLFSMVLVHGTGEWRIASFHNTLVT